jgi:hypothetical protein
MTELFITIAIIGAVAGVFSLMALLADWVEWWLG